MFEFQVLANKADDAADGRTDADGHAATLIKGESEDGGRVEARKSSRRLLQSKPSDGTHRHRLTGWRKIISACLNFLP